MHHNILKCDLDYGLFRIINNYNQKGLYKTAAKCLWE